MTTPHTPGPWNVDDKFFIWAPGTPRIAEVILRDVSINQQKANAALIAAAPEMKTLLRDAVQWLGKMIADKGHEQSVMPNHCVKTMMKIEALLTKLDN